MKVKLRVQISGTRDGVEWPKPGETLVVGADEAKSLIETGIAVEVAEEPKAKAETKTKKPATPAKVETAKAPAAPEKATVPTTPAASE